VDFWRARMSYSDLERLLLVPLREMRLHNTATRCMIPRVVASCHWYTQSYSPTRERETTRERERQLPRVIRRHACVCVRKGALSLSLSLRLSLWVVHVTRTARDQRKGREESSLGKKQDSETIKTHKTYQKNTKKYRNCMLMSCNTLALVSGFRV
jgi:hypothetical protein